MKPRTVMIGIDGAPYGLLRDLSDRGVMPNLAKLRKEGMFRKMRSSLPEVSSVSWSSIITGTNPGEHGIFGFTDLSPGSYGLTFPNFDSLRTKPFWKQDDRKYVIINVPSTFPARELNGFLVSGFVSLDLERATYPGSYVPILEGMGYEIDVDASKGHTAKSELLRDLSRVHGSRMELCRRMWKEMDWDTFMIVFTGSDRLGHFLWDAYEDEGHEHHQGFLDYFAMVDESIGEIVSMMEPGDNLLMCSDHGMELTRENVNVNKVLEDNGYLMLDRGSGSNYEMIAGGTRAFAMDPGRIYLNREGRYPRGCVTKSEEEALIRDLVKLFRELEIGGRKVMKAVYRKEEIYSGPCMDKSPDIVLLADRGFNLKASMSMEKPGRAITGNHTHDDAFLYVRGNKNEYLVPSDPCVEDIRKILSFWKK